MGFMRLILTKKTFERVKWVKLYTFDKDLFLHAVSVGAIQPEDRIIMRHKDSEDKTIFIATDETMMNTVDDICPDDMIFDVWGKVQILEVWEADDDDEPTRS